MLTSFLLSITTATAATSFAAALALGTDQGGSRAQQAPARAASVPARSVASRPAATAPVPTRSVRLTNDSLAGQPFGEEPTVQGLLASGGRVVARRPFRNLHEAGQTDTILLVRHQGNVFEFYRAPEKDMLRDAIITNFQPGYGRRLRTRLATAHQPGPTTVDKVRIGDTERTNSVLVVYQSGRLSAVHVVPYVD